MTNFIALPGNRSLGSLGREVAPLAWGMWRFAGSDLAHARRLVETAIDSGYSLLDTADVYGYKNRESFGAAEALLGRVLAAAPGLRRRFVLATKGGIVPGVPYDSSASYLTSACEASLRRLGTETIDLYQIHRPDILTHPEEVAGALSKLRDSGKIRGVGVSNYTAAQIRALRTFLPFPIVSHQFELSALCIPPLSDATLDQAIENNMAVLAWSPLGGGRLGGAGGTEGAGATGGDRRLHAVAEVLDKLAVREGASRTDVALAWVLAHPARPIAIVGTQNPQRIAAATQALKVRLTRTDWYEILAASRQERLP